MLILCDGDMQGLVAMYEDAADIVIRAVFYGTSSYFCPDYLLRTYDFLLLKQKSKSRHFTNSLCNARFLKNSWYIYNAYLMHMFICILR